MINIETLRELFGWCLAINVGIMLVTTVMLVGARGWVSKMHGRMFGLDERDLARSYFSYLANYKVIVLVFVLVPYLALCIVGSSGG